MVDIVIDEEFKLLHPALDEETYALLEENLLQHGCRDALVLWNYTLIDGHNRYEICQKHGIPFYTVSKDFAAREDAIFWIISIQVSRRNLTQMQLSHYRDMQYRSDTRLFSDHIKKGSYGTDRAIVSVPAENKKPIAFSATDKPLLVSSIHELTADLFSKLHDTKGENRASELKDSFRLYIDMLEDLYKHMVA